MSDEREVLILKLQRAEVDVVLEGPDGAEHRWVLRELSGSERNKYLNRMQNRIKVGSGGTTTIKSFDGFQSELLTLSLVDENGSPVEKDIIEGLPSSTQMALFNKAQKISGLDEGKDKKGEEGND